MGEAINRFKQCHNRHKRNPEFPHRLDDLDELLDFRAATGIATSLKSQRFTPYIQTITVPAETESPDVPENRRPIVLGLSCYPGFLFFPAALDHTLQQNLTYQALTEYCEPPYRTNIESIPPKSSELILPVENISGKYAPMWKLWSTESTEERQQQQQQCRYYRCLQKLSWATLGYFYDWTNRCYHKDEFSPFPHELAALGRVFARVSFSLAEEPKRNKGWSYDPSACIVNYYGEKGVMGGHRDELEMALDKPIVSISLGRPAVFVLGGKTLQDEPIIPMIVRSGDVIVLGGDSRLNYHSMSRVLPNTLPCCPIRSSVDGSSSVVTSIEGFFWNQQLSENDRLSVDRYLADHRININIRQVYNKENNSID